MQISCLEGLLFWFWQPRINKTIKTRDITEKMKAILAAAAAMLMAIINNAAFAADSSTTQQPGIQVSGSSTFTIL
jgi:type II secretory pathway component PulM